MALRSRKGLTLKVELANLVDLYSHMDKLIRNNMDKLIRKWFYCCCPNVLRDYSCLTQKLWNNVNVSDGLAPAWEGVEVTSDRRGDLGPNNCTEGGCPWYR